MSAHLLHLHGFWHGVPDWRMTCEHPDSDPAWIYRNEDGTPDLGNIGECWLRSWWDEEGAELLKHDGPITVLPIPVRPSADWDYENGGWIEVDA